MLLETWIICSLKCLVNQCSNPESFPCLPPATLLADLCCSGALGREEAAIRRKLAAGSVLPGSAKSHCAWGFLSSEHWKGSDKPKPAWFWMLLRCVSISKVYAEVFLFS